MKTCSRCKGQMHQRHDMHGPYFDCLHCGHNLDIEATPRPAKPYAQDLNAGRVWPEEKQRRTRRTRQTHCQYGHLMTQLGNGYQRCTPCHNERSARYRREQKEQANA